MPKHGYDQMDGAAVGGAYQADTGGNDSPMSFEEIERPPLRHVDKYVRAECPCIKTTRYTISLMTCLGFIISFGMRCNMGMAKLQFENGVSCAPRVGPGVNCTSSISRAFHRRW